MDKLIDNSLLEMGIKTSAGTGAWKSNFPLVLEITDRLTNRLNNEPTTEGHEGRGVIQRVTLSIMEGIVKHVL